MSGCGTVLPEMKKKASSVSRHVVIAFLLLLIACVPATYAVLLIKGGDKDLLEREVVSVLEVHGFAEWPRSQAEDPRRGRLFRRPGHPLIVEIVRHENGIEAHAQVGADRVTPLGAHEFFELQALLTDRFGPDRIAVLRLPDEIEAYRTSDIQSRTSEAEAAQLGFHRTGDAK
jgi:hypothetical protein